MLAEKLPSIWIMLPSSPLSIIRFSLIGWAKMAIMADGHLQHFTASASRGAVLA